MFADHPQRGVLNAELHARPFMAIAAPDQVLHLALLSGEDERARDWQDLARFCARWQIATPSSGNHFTAELGPCRLKWERHAEFVAYTLFCAGRPEHAWATIEAAFPADWVTEMGPRLLVATRLSLVGSAGAELATPDFGAAAAMLGRVPAAAALVMKAGAAVWTDFRIDPTGRSNILLVDRGLRDNQAGRLVQRLLEIETYTMMALLALPLAQAAGPVLRRIGDGVAAIAEAMAVPERSPSDRELLDRLLRDAAELETLVAGNSYRLSAAAAYHGLVEARLAELREERIEGMPSIGEFLERRFAPAMATCRSVAARQDALSQRLARVANLLRTRVDIALEDQNRRLLQSMDRRAKLQLRLQETVEGLSIVAISYYLLGLLDHALHGIEAFGVHLPVGGISGVAVPLALATVWLAGRRLRRRLTQDAGLEERA